MSPGQSYYHQLVEHSSGIILAKLNGRPSIENQLDTFKVHIDAMGTPTEIAKLIIDGDGDYSSSLKGNQPGLTTIPQYFDETERWKGLNRTQ